MSRNLIPWIIFFTMLLLDYYGFSAIKSAFRNSSSSVQKIASILYWSLTAFAILYFLSFWIFNFREHSTPLSRIMTGIFMGIFVSKLFLTIFLLFEDIIRGIFWIINRIQPNAELFTSRRQFLDSVFIGVASLPFFSFIYGMVKTSSDYQVKKIKVPIANLPKELQGITIAQISDIHSGSFIDIEPLHKAIKIINDLNPDIFVFTGDLVNNKAEEFPRVQPIFKNIKAKYGQFSVLGNHDYGDYVEWESDEAKLENLNTLKQYHKDTNWELLCNENRVLTINGEKIALIGVENYGANMRFKKYGRLKKAYKGVENIDTKILFSHDPSHWDAEVNKKYKDIQLTLSGHTHGMQFGVENKWFRFSPVQWFYKQWAGLYTIENQHIYVNRGLGFIGYPGRVGIRPEITLLELVLA